MSAFVLHEVWVTGGSETATRKAAYLPDGAELFRTHCRYAITDKDKHGKSLHYRDMSSVWYCKQEPRRGKHKHLTKLPDALVKIFWVLFLRTERSHSGFLFRQWNDSIPSSYYEETGHWI